MMRAAVLVIAFAIGGWMTFDGTRALTTGDYVTPSSGAYAGRLGPWAGIVRAVGIDPRSTVMKASFVLLGVLWLTSAVAFIAGASRIDRQKGPRAALGTLAVMTLWFAPVGTSLSLVLLALLFFSRGTSA